MVERTYYLENNEENAHNLGDLVLNEMITVKSVETVECDFKKVVVTFDALFVEEIDEYLLGAGK
jgi:hypothetical protein